jgi:positive regulator of sigma E activity
MKNSINRATIDHAGIVQRKDDKSVTVRISSASACSGCHAEGSCSLSGKEEKIIEVPGSYNVKPGDNVTILMKKSMGYAALLLGYILPMITVIVSLIILISMNVNELVAGLTSLLMLLPYYVILFLLRKRINNKFTFLLEV